MEKNSPRACTIEAPCKINLHLRIKERRADGFHALESLFAPLALGDTLRFDLAGEKGDCHLFSPMEIPMKENLVYRAVSLFRERTGFRNGVRIRLDKRIPAGAGLGGGSSDAASALMAMNLLAGGVLPMEELKKMGALLGSDVPFFLAGGAAYVSGRGELIEPVSLPGGLWVVLVKPPFASDTTSAYRLLDEVRERGAGNEIRREQASRETLIRALAGDPLDWPFHNDFLTVFLDSNTSPEAHDEPHARAYRGILENLREAGASFSGLSGSGSCCFGIFKAKETAEKAEKALSGQENYVSFTFFLARKANTVLE